MELIVSINASIAAFKTATLLGATKCVNRLCCGRCGMDLLVVNAHLYACLPA